MDSSRSLGRRLVDDAALAQHQHPVGEAEHLGHLAGDEQDADAASRRAGG